MRTLSVILLTFAITNVCVAQTFTATLTGEQVIRGGVAGPTLPFRAIGEFELVVDEGNPDNTSLTYSVTAPDFDFDGQRTPELNDDVTAVHLHTLTECAATTCISGDTAGTKHVLNIFGAPREDDPDLTIDSAESIIRGNWDPSDANTLTPAPTADPNDFIDELRNGQLFIMIHTREFPAGAIGGVLVPEPSSFGLTAIVGLVAAVGRCRKRR